MELYDHFEGWVQNYCNSFTHVKRWQWFCTKPSIYNLTFCIIFFLHIICHFVLFCMYVLFYVVTCPYGPWLIQINLETLKPTQWSLLASRKWERLAKNDYSAWEMSNEKRTRQYDTLSRKCWILRRLIYEHLMLFQRLLSLQLACLVRETIFIGCFHCYQSWYYFDYYSN